MVLRHVRLAHVLGQTGRGRLLPGEIIRRLRAIADREAAVLVEVRRFLHHGDQFAARDLAQRLAGALRPAHVLGEQAGVGLAHPCQRLARDEMDDVVQLHAGVRLAPPKNGNIDHSSGYFTVVDAELAFASGH